MDMQVPTTISVRAKVPPGAVIWNAALSDKKFLISTAEISYDFFSHLPKFYFLSPSFDVRLTWFDISYVIYR